MVRPLIEINISLIAVYSFSKRGQNKFQVIPLLRSALQFHRHPYFDFFSVTKANKILEIDSDENRELKIPMIKAVLRRSYTERFV